MIHLKTGDYCNLNFYIKKDNYFFYYKNNGVS